MNYKTFSSRLLRGVLFLSLMAFLPGCGENQGPAEQAGEKIDKAIEQTGDSMKDAMEKTGDAMNEAAEKTGGALNEAMEGAQEKMGEMGEGIKETAQEAVDKADKMVEDAKK